MRELAVFVLTVTLIGWALAHTERSSAHFDPKQSPTWTEKGSNWPDKKEPSTRPAGNNGLEEKSGRIKKTAFEPRDGHEAGHKNFTSASLEPPES